MAAAVQGVDRAVQIRHQPRIRGSLAIAELSRICLHNKLLTSIPQELRPLLEATATLRIGHSPQVPAMYRTLLLLLYGSGMRIGEALRLTCGTSI